MPKRILSAVVHKVINHNTVSVTVTNVKTHPLYKKVIRMKKKYMAHVPDLYKIEVGQSVRIEESRPLSKLKKWVLKLV